MTASPGQTIAGILAMQPVIPVVTLAHAEDAGPLAETLVAAGLRVIEVTLRTPAALAAIRLASGVEGAMVGAGTVLNRSDCEAAAHAGAQFIVSPGLSEGVVMEARGRQMLVLPGVSTPSELMRGLDLGLSCFKFFPAEASGGVSMLKALQGPFPDARFCPTGGVSFDLAPRYLELSNVACVGATWAAPPELIRAGAWDRIATLAGQAASLRA